MRSDELYLHDILIACHDIADFVEGQDFEEFVNNRMMRRAIMQALTEIGEASARVSIELKDRYPDAAWDDARAFRNFAVHQYFAIVWETVWRTATVDVNEFQGQIEAIVETDFPEL